LTLHDKNTRLNKWPFGAVFLILFRLGDGKGQLGAGARRGTKQTISSAGEQARQSSHRLTAMASQHGRVVKSQLLFASH